MLNGFLRPNSVPFHSTRMPQTAVYKTLDLYNLSKKCVAACYELSSSLPTEEKTNLSHHLRQAGISAHVAIAQGVFLKKKKSRLKFLLDGQRNLTVIDAIVDVLIELEFIKEEASAELISLSSACYEGLEELKKDEENEK